MPDHQGRQDFPEVADEKINIGSFNEWAPLGVSDIYSPKEEPRLRDQVMLDQAAMLKEIVTVPDDNLVMMMLLIGVHTMSEQLRGCQSDPWVAKCVIYGNFFLVLAIPSTNCLFF